MEQSSDAPKKLGIGEYLMRHMREYGLLFALIGIMIFFQLVTDGTLLKPVNVTNLLLQNSYIIIMALGMLIGRVCYGVRRRLGRRNDRGI